MGWQLNDDGDGYVWVDEDNDAGYTGTGSNTNVDAVQPGGDSGPGLEVGKRLGSDTTGWQTLNADGSITYQDPDGSVYTKTHTGNYITDFGGTKWQYDPTTGKFSDLGGSGADSGVSGLLKQIQSAFTKKVNGQDVTDWKKVGVVGGLLANATGLNKVETPGYKGAVKEYTAVNAPINYDDPNRRPGAGGRQYFTPTQFVEAKDVDAAKTAANTQAQGILANYRKAEAPVNKWGSGAAIPAVAMPWVKQPASTTAGGVASLAADKFMTPEEKLASLTPATVVAPSSFIGGTPDVVANQVTSGQQMTDPNVGPQPQRAAQGGIMDAAKGRYLRGDTDGMADEIETSIDGEQPARLSHGEFVVPADVVSHLGNGNSDAGADKLYKMMDKIRVARTGTKKQGKQINPDKFLPGGPVGYSSGGVASLATGGPATNTSTSGNLSEWAGPAVTTTIGKGIAAADQPYQAYTGPLTAGASDLQQQQFAGLSGLASTGLAPTQYTTGTFDTAAAQKYMNPYIQTALDPQLKEMQRQSDIARLADASRLTGAGAYGGSRQAIMEAEGRRNLLEKQGAAIGQGYQTAYDKAMQQYNADMGRQLSTQQAQQAANEASAQFGLKSLDALGQAGATQRAIEAEGIKADKEQFEEQRDWDKKMAQYKMGLFSGLPTATQVNTANMNPITEWLQTSGNLQKLLEEYNKPG